MSALNDREVGFIIGDLIQDAKTDEYGDPEAMHADEDAVLHYIVAEVARGRHDEKLTLMAQRIVELDKIERTRWYA